MDNNVNNLFLIMQRMKQVMPGLPFKVGNEVVNFALDNFKREAWQGTRMEPWKKRKNPTKWGQAPPRNGRKILIDKGRLRRSIRVAKADWQSIVVGSDVPYAKVHNEGFRGTVNQAVGSFTRKQVYAGVASKFKVNGEQFETGAAMSLKTRSALKNRKVVAKTMVTGYNRKIKQNLPKRQFLGNSPYLNQRIQRVVTAEIMKAFNQ